MKKPTEIMEIELPNAAAADLTTKAAQAGIPTQEYIGIQALAGAYGIFHPEVVAFNKRSKPGITGPETQGDQE